MSKAKTLKVDRETAEATVEAFVRALRAREEARGTDSSGSGMYALGYLESMVADIIKDNPHLLSIFIARTNSVLRDTTHA